MINIITKNVYADCDWCPPANKDQGRVGCILKIGKPGDFSAYYYNACAEATGETNSYEPKIKVRNQSCNFAACWTKSKSLKWNGECVMWPGGYGFPPNRYCARVAVKGDHGYTEGVYLDNQGNTRNDPLYTASDGSTFKLELPKLCAYHDPSFVETLQDIIDIIPNYSAFHKTDQIHPLADLIITTVENSLPISLAVKTFVSLTGLNSLGEPFVDALTIVIGGWYGLGEVAFSEFLKVIKQEMKMNKIVYKGLGCVNIPLAPGPERYCPFLSQPIIKPTVETVCRTLNGGGVENSTLTNPCVVSNNANDLIKNTIRVTYNQYLPICEPTQDPYITDSCVKIHFKTGTNANTPSVLYTFSGNKDVISKCPSATPTEAQKPCVSTKLARSTYRLTYAMMSGASNTQRLDSFAADLRNCSATTSTPNAFCQKIWGVNAGDYVDLTVSFPPRETSYNTSELTTSGNILDTYGNPKTFQASIVRTPLELSTLGIIQQPTQICVYEGTSKAKLIGCKDRIQSPPKPSVFTCGSAQSTIPCTSTYYNPKIVLQLQSGTNITQGALEVDSIYNKNLPTIINLAGFDYSSFATDDTYSKVPFTVPPAKDAGTIYGTYTPSGQEPFNSSGIRSNTSIKYLSGLEYVQGRYSLGAKRICLNGFAMEDCSENIRNCVLTKLANNNIVNCSTLFDYATSKYPGLRQCTSSENSCANIDTLPRKTGGTAINVKSCSSGGNTIYCYQNSTPLCTVTLGLSDRVNPPYSGLGSEILNDTKYFNYQTTSYDRNLYTVRSKTEVEQGLCVLVPDAPKCTAINATSGNSAANGYAVWSETNLGVQAQGTCISGYSMETGKPVTRNCVLDFSSGTPQPKFDNLINGYTCKANLPAVCSAINATAGNSAANGYATWDITSVGAQATGNCITGFTKLTGRPVQRNCVLDNSVTPATGKFNPLINNYTCVRKNLEIVGLDTQSNAALILAPSTHQIENGFNTIYQSFEINYDFNDSIYKDFKIKIGYIDPTKLNFIRLREVDAVGAYAIQMNGTTIKLNTSYDYGMLVNYPTSTFGGLYYPSESNMNLYTNLAPLTTSSSTENQLNIRVAPGAHGANARIRLKFEYNLKY